MGRENNRSKFGICARPEDYSNAHIRVIHVLNYMYGSPLEKAGMIANTDYIIGTFKETFNNLDP